MSVVPTRISEVQVGERYRKTVEPLQGLMESIETVGLLHPIVVTPDLTLVAGHRRLEACRRLGWTQIPARVMPLSPAEMLRAEHDENEIRKAFTAEERVAIARAIETEERAAARERQAAVGGTAPGKLPEAVETGVSRDRAAKAVGWSGRTYEKAKAVVEAAEADELLRPVVDEMNETGKVDPAYQKVTAATFEDLVAEFPAASGLPERSRPEALAGYRALTRMDEPERSRRAAIFAKFIDAENRRDFEQEDRDRENARRVDRLAEAVTVVPVLVAQVRDRGLALDDSYDWPDYVAGLRAAANDIEALAVPQLRRIK